jgi:hypothetical protein
MGESAIPSLFGNRPTDFRAATRRIEFNGLDLEAKRLMAHTDFLTVREVAKYQKFKERAIYRLVAKGAFLPLRLEARCVSGVLKSLNRSLPARRIEISRVSTAKRSSRMLFPGRIKILILGS